MRLIQSLLMLAALLAATPALSAPDRAAEIDRLKPLADGGDAATQYRLGVLYAESQKLF